MDGSWRGISAGTCRAVRPSWCRTCRGPAACGPRTISTSWPRRTDRPARARHGHAAPARPAGGAVRRAEIQLARQRERRGQRRPRLLGKAVQDHRGRAQPRDGRVRVRIGVGHRDLSLHPQWRDRHQVQGSHRLSGQCRDAACGRARRSGRQCGHLLDHPGLDQGGLGARQENHRAAADGEQKIRISPTCRWRSTWRSTRRTGWCST